MAKQVIGFHYTLKDSQGKLIETSKDREPLVFLEASGQIIPDLEVIILTLNVGDKKEVSIPHARAYGVYNQNLIYKIPKAKFPAKEIKMGDVFQMGTQGSVQSVTVLEVSDAEVVLDANHPLAGVDLNFLVEVISRRDATAEELSHGHVHGEGGHHHH